MSWHLSHRLTRIHQAVSITLLCSVGSAILLPTAQAATMGKTVITSAQHEPLAASISVSDINAADFVASLASPMIYQQMGLTPTASMSIRFVPTSATTGQVLINTSQPISMPFADVVLAINDNGKRNVVPKTLLMPLSGKAAVKPSSQVIAGAQKPNLPVTSNSLSKPLMVREGAPPPLLNTPHTQTVQQIEPQTQVLSQKTPALPVINAPGIAAVQSENNAAPLKMSQVSDMPNMMASIPQPDTSKTVNTVSTASMTSTSLTNQPNNKVLTPNNDTQASSLSNTDSANKQLDILNIQVTRQIQLKDKPSSIGASQPTPLIMSAKNNPVNQNSNDNNSQNNKVASETASQLQAEQPLVGQLSTGQPSAIADNISSYQVQRNDNLWIISQQIAQQNNIDVQTVMQQIKNQNPDAFIAQNSDLLKADAKLNLPRYDVLPSQQNMQTAIAAQRQYYLQSNSAKLNKNKTKPADSKSTDEKQTVAAKPISASTKSPAKKRDEPVRTVTKTLPQAQFSVLAPGRNGSADGTQTAAGAAAAGNGLSTDILATLNSARQRTANQAKKVAITSNTLGKYTQRLQLQNQKLADLQARLKKLRNQ